MKVFKKTVVVCLALLMCISLCACGKSKAFNVSKEAYEQLKIAYEIADAFGSDVHEAWHLGIYDDDELIDGGAKYLASELNLSVKEIKDGIAYYWLVEIGEEDWETTTEKEKWYDIADVTFVYIDSEGMSLFTYCVNIVQAAFKANGKAEEAQKALDTAKGLMKELSDKYSDYEHYANLKGFFTTTSSYLTTVRIPAVALKP